MNVIDYSLSQTTLEHVGMIDARLCIMNVCLSRSSFVSQANNEITPLLIWKMWLSTTPLRYLRQQFNHSFKQQTEPTTPSRVVRRLSTRISWRSLRRLLLIYASYPWSTLATIWCSMLIVHLRQHRTARPTTMITSFAFENGQEQRTYLIQFRFFASIFFRFASDFQHVCLNISKYTRE